VQSWLELCPVPPHLRQPRFEGFQSPLNCLQLADLPGEFPNLRVFLRFFCLHLPREIVVPRLQFADGLKHQVREFAVVQLLKALAI